VGSGHRADQGGKAWKVKRSIAGGGGSWRFCGEVVR
jgi:hypothetical protein